MLISDLCIAQDLESLSAKEYIARNPTIERIKIVHFLVNQFEEFKENGISQSQLDKIWTDDDLKEKLHLSRFQIINQKLYASSHNATGKQFLLILNYLKRLVTEPLANL